MTDHVARLYLPEIHLHALECLLIQLPLSDYIWVLSGSGGLRLQGVDVPLEDELKAYLAMGRTGKEALICQLLQQAGKVNLPVLAPVTSPLCRPINVTAFIP